MFVFSTSGREGSPPVSRAGDWRDRGHPGDPLLLACAPTHPLADHDRVDLAALAGEPFVDFPAAFGLRAGRPALRRRVAERTTALEVNDVPTDGNRHKPRRLRPAQHAPPAATQDPASSATDAVTVDRDWAWGEAGLGMLRIRLVRDRALDYGRVVTCACR